MTGLSENLETPFTQRKPVKIESTLNQRAHRICEFLQQLQEELRIVVQRTGSGTTVHDYGVNCVAGLRAGVHLAEICMAGLAEIKIGPGSMGQSLSVYTDHPVAACLASQYAGWQVSEGDYFAMGSGPMRCASAKEELFGDIGFAEKPTHVVGVLESSKLPTDAVCEQLASDCGVTPADVTLCVAPTASMSGNIQVVARSVETTLHKLHELGFDLSTIRSGFGSAPLPPVAENDLAGIGRTNDAILYGGEVTLWIEGDDEKLADIVERVPSKASRDFGVPFAEIFKRYDGDFYKIDPHLFSPARVSLMNLTSGRTFSSGELREDLVRQSFGQ